MVKQKTTLTLDSDLVELAKARKLNISQICNDSLRGLLELDSTLDEHRQKADSLAAELMAINIEIRRREDIKLEALTVARVKAAHDELKDHKIAQWVKIRDRKIDQEGSVPKPVRKHWAAKIGCTLKELDAF